MVAFSQNERTIHYTMEKEPWQRTSVLKNSARRHYQSKKLRFHIFQHAVEVQEVARKKAEQCIANGIAVDIDVIDAAAFWHDAGYARNYEKLGFESREKYAAHLAKEDLTKLGMPKPKILKTMGAIACTEAGTICVEPEDFVIRQADLDNVSGGTGRFLRNTLLLREEYELINNTSMGIIDFAKMSYGYLERLTEQNLSMGEGFDMDPNGLSPFNNHAKTNIKLLLPPFSEKLFSWIGVHYPAEEIPENIITNQIAS